MNYEEKIRILKQMRSEGAPIVEIANTLQVSTSTVSRYIAKERLQMEDRTRVAVSKRKLTKDQFLRRAEEKHGDFYDYAKVQFVDAATKVEIVCPIHGSFWQTPTKHLAGHGCTHVDCVKARKLQTCKRRRDLSDSGQKGESTSIEDILADCFGSVSYVFSGIEDRKRFVASAWPYGFEREAIASIIGRSPSTVGRYVAEMGLSAEGRLSVSDEGSKYAGKDYSNLKYTTDEFIWKARAVHGDTYDYAKVHYVNSKTKVEIVCPEHGPFWMEPNKHLQGCGCNHIECVRRKAWDTMRLRYGVGHALQSGQFLDKSRDTLYSHYGVDNPMCVKECVEKVTMTKSENGTFHVSKPETKLCDLLMSYFGESDVECQYFSDVYPFACDFYIRSLDLHVELNASWTHGSHWFDPENMSDSKLLSLWKEKGISSKYYQNAVYTWTDLDVRKRETARNNQLNYVVFWNNDLSDAKLWFDLGCPDGKDWERMYSWMPGRKI